MLSENHHNARKKIPAFEYAVNLLAAREHSRMELRQKMLRKEYPPPEIDAALAECSRLGYQDDRHFAVTMAEMMQSSGRGERLIRQKLQQKGIAGELINEILESRSEDCSDEEAARIAASSKQPAWNRESDFRKRREKMLRFLLGRGFRFSLALQIVRELEQGAAG